MRITSTYPDAATLQARLAARLVGALNEQAAAVPHDISERLRVAREQAVARARESRQRAPAGSTSAVLAGASGGAAILGLGSGGQPPWWQRMASVLPLAVLLAGLLVIGQVTSREQIMAAAEIDSVLLADDLPPAAYTDPGFAEFLNSPSP